MRARKSSASRSTSAAARAQRRQVERDHGQPVVEIGAEPAFLDGEREILAGGRDDGDVQGLVARAAEATHRALLDDLQQLRLQRDRQQADLVEEDRPAIGRLEESRLGLPRVGEGAALEAEQLGLEQRLGNGRAVDVHERPAPPGAVAVNGLGQEPFACSGLAQDEDRRQPAARAHGRAEQATGLSAHLGDRRAVAQESAQTVHGLHRSSGSAIVQPRQRQQTGVDDG